jgi:hypothetical protein
MVEIVTSDHLLRVVPWIADDEAHATNKPMVDLQSATLLSYRSASPTRQTAIARAADLQVNVLNFFVAIRDAANITLAVRWHLASPIVSATLSLAYLYRFAPCDSKPALR